MSRQVDAGKHQATIDFLVSRVPRLEAEIIKRFCAINRLRRKDLFTIMAHLVTSKGGWLRTHEGGTGFDELDTLVKQFLKEHGGSRWSDMSFVEKYLGMSIRPVPHSDVRKIQAAIMAETLPEEEEE